MWPESPVFGDRQPCVSASLPSLGRWSVIFPLEQLSPPHNQALTLSHPHLAAAWVSHVKEHLPGVSLDEELLGLVTSCAGFTCDFAGGPLEGRVAMVLERPARPWQAAGAGIVVPFADAMDAQYAIVSTRDGRIGCSFSGEFSQVYEDFSSMLTDALHWWGFKDWYYVFFSAGYPRAELVPPDLTTPVKSPDGCFAWRIGRDWAVSWHLSPNGLGQPEGATSYIAKDAVSAAALCEWLRSRGQQVLDVGRLGRVGQYIPGLDPGSPD